MNASRGWALVFLLVAPVQVQAADQFLSDSLGDRLPDGAIARLGTTRLRLRCFSNHESPGLLFAPSGKHCVSFGGERQLQIWETAKGKELAPLDSYLWREARHVAFSRDGKLLAAGRLRVGVWNFATGKIVRFTEGPPEDVRALAFTENSTAVIFVDGGGVVRWWDVTKGQLGRDWNPLKELKWTNPGINPPTRLSAAAFSPDASILVAHLCQPISRYSAPVEGGNITVAWDVKTGGEIWRLSHKSGPRHFAFTPDGKRLACDFGWSEIGVVDASTGTIQCRIASGDTRLESFKSFIFAPDGKSLFIGGSGPAVIRWSIDAKRPLQPIHFSPLELTTTIDALAISPDGKSMFASVNGCLQLIELASGKARLAFDGHHRDVVHMAFTSDGAELITGSWNGSSTFEIDESLRWDLATGKLKARSHLTTVWSRHGMRTASADHSIGLLVESDRHSFIDIADKRVLGTVRDARGISDPSLGFFSPTNRYFLACTVQGKDLIAYDVQTGEKLCNLPVHYYDCRTFSPDDRLIALQKDNLILVFEIDTGKTLATVSAGQKPHTGIRETLAFSPDSKLLAAWDECNNDVVIWDIQSEKQVRRLPSNGKDRVHNLRFAWSPDGRLFVDAGATDENRIRLWDVATGKLLREFPGHGDPICALAFSPDSRLLASGSTDTTVLIWDLKGH